MFLITIVGTGYHEMGSSVYLDQKLKLVSEPTNKHDTEAIKVIDEVSDLQIGYVANSVKTVARGCCSAGRLGELFRVGDAKKKAKIILMGDTIIAQVDEI